MATILLFVLVFSGGLAARPSSAEAQLPGRVAFHLEAHFLDEFGRPSTVIAYPEREPEAAELAVSIQQAISERYGFQPEIRSSADIQESDYRLRTVIHLGNIWTNPELLWFYLYGYTFVDASYPGAGGYVIRQVYDPHGFGRNVLILGASNRRGLEAGVARFLVELEDLPQPKWSEFLIVDSDTPPVRQVPKKRSREEIERWRLEFRSRMDQGALRRLAEDAIEDALYYYLSGNENYLARFEAIVPAHLEFLHAGGNHRAAQIYFWLHKYVQIWDAIEESAYWSDEFRNLVRDLLFGLSEVVAEIGHFESSNHPFPKYNHETFPAMSLFFASEYFRKYYDLRPAERWRELADGVMQTQLQFVRGSDESAGYFTYTPTHAIYYSIATRDDSFVTSGRARRLADFFMALTDNTGEWPGFGDARAFSYHRGYYALLPLANLLGDPGLLGLDAVTRDLVENPDQIWELKYSAGHYHSLGYYIPPVQPALPPDPPEVQLFPLEEMLHEFSRSRKWYFQESADAVTGEARSDSDVAYQDTFDKIVFRTGYDRTGQYLLLDGWGRGIHGHLDANAVAGFVDNDRIFVVDSTYYRRTPNYQNSLMVIRDGRGEIAPEFAALEQLSDLERTAFSRTVIRDFNRINWRRNIFWLKGDLFAVIDEVEARSPGQYTLQLFWRGLGELTQEPNRVELVQAGRQVMGLSYSSPAKVRVLADDSDEDRRLLRHYPHAESMTHRIMQYATPEMQAGDEFSFQSSLYTFNRDHPRSVSHSSLGSGVLMIREAEDHAIFFARSDQLPNEVVTDAAMGVVSDQTLALVKARSLELFGRPLLESSAPVDLEVDLQSGRGLIQSTEAATGVLFGTEWTVPAGEEIRLPLNLVGEDVGRPLRNFFSRTWEDSVVPEETFPRRNEAPVLENVWTALSDWGENSAAAAGDLTGDGRKEVVVGSRSGCRVFGLLPDADGGPRLIWSYLTDSTVRSVTMANLSGLGTNAVVLGTETGQLIALDGFGKEIWSIQLPVFPQARFGSSNRIHVVGAADTTADGKDEIVATTDTSLIYYFTPEGELIWSQPVYLHDIISLAFGDVDGDGRKEILVGSYVYRLHAFKQDGRYLWSFRIPSTQNIIRTGDLTGDGIEEVVSGSSDLHLYALQTDQESASPREYVIQAEDARGYRKLFNLDTGGDVFALDVADVTGDGRSEIVAGSDSFFLYRMDGQGRLGALRNAGDVVRHLRVFSNRPEGTLIGAGLLGGKVLLLSEDLEIQGRAELQSEPLFLDFDPVEKKLIGVAKDSVRVFELP